MAATVGGHDQGKKTQAARKRDSRKSGRMSRSVCGSERRQREGTLCRQLELLARHGELGAVDTMRVVVWLWIRLKRGQAHEPAPDEVRGGGPDDSREGAPYLVRHGRLDGERIEGHLVKVERNGMGRGGASEGECSPGTTRTEMRDV
jgi:hypothetical protein